MGGKSAKDEAMEQMQGLAKDQFTRASALPNRFENYADPFSYSQQQQGLQGAVGYGAGEINRTANNTLANAARGTASRMASQGITGGSALNQGIAQSQNPINQSRMGSLASLYGGYLNQLPGLMGTANERAFGLRGAQQQQDYAKLGAQGSALGYQGQVAQQQNDSTWLDDAFAGLNTVANLGSAFSGFGLFGGGKQPGKSTVQ